MDIRILLRSLTALLQSSSNTNAAMACAQAYVWYALMHKCGTVERKSAKGVAIGLSALECNGIRSIALAGIEIF